MAIKKTSKEEILKESIKLFKIRGYSNTSMANIAEACGLIKGSIYHHFKSKEEIGLESLKYIHNYFVEHIFSIAFRSDLSDKQKIELIVKKTDDYFLHSEGGCLLGNLALEASCLNLDFKEEIKSYFTAWENALIKIFENKRFRKCVIVSETKCLFSENQFFCFNSNYIVILKILWLTNILAML